MLLVYHGMWHSSEFFFLFSIVATHPDCALPSILYVLSEKIDNKHTKLDKGWWGVHKTLHEILIYFLEFNYEQKRHSRQ